MARKAPRSEMGGGPAEPAGLLCVAQELGYGVYTHHRGMLELYEQLTATKVYHAHKTQINHPNDTRCRLCGKTAQSIPHVLASCSALAQNKYLARQCGPESTVLENAKRASTLWYSATVVFSGCPKAHLRVTPGPSILGYTSPQVSEHVKQNRVDARFIDHEKKKVLLAG